MENKVIIGIEYCENDLDYMGVFSNPKSFIDHIEKRFGTRDIFDIVDKKVKKPDWGLDCTFKVKQIARVTNLGYLIDHIR